MPVKPARRQFVVAAALLAWVSLAPLPASAQDFGPPPGQPIVDCDTVTIDPPGQFVVVFHLVVDGRRVDRAGTNIPGTSLVPVDISDLTDARESVRVKASATWNLGTGSSATTDVTLDCGEGPRAEPIGDFLVPAGPAGAVPGAPPGPAVPVEAAPDFVG